MARGTRQVIHIIRKQNSGGAILNVSSVGGQLDLPVLSAYHSTRFALEALSESMSFELEPFRIRVVKIEPGVIRTNIVNLSAPSKKALDTKSSYFSLMQNVESKSLMKNASSPF